MLINHLVIACAAAVGALAAPAVESTNTNLIESRDTPAGQGTNNGFFYSFYTDGGGTVSYNNGAAGLYTTNWKDVGNFVAGKGWKPGSARYASFPSASYTYSSNQSTEQSNTPARSPRAETATSPSTAGPRTL
jgi:endo-1,4-beta-xylanase